MSHTEIIPVSSHNPTRQEKMDGCAKFLKLLWDLKPHPMVEVRAVLGPDSHSQRASDLRKKGWPVEFVHKRDRLTHKVLDKGYVLRSHNLTLDETLAAPTPEHELSDGGF